MKAHFTVEPVENPGLDLGVYHGRVADPVLAFTHHMAPS